MSGCTLLNQDAGVVAGCGALGALISADLEAGVRGAQVVIDFALADGLAQRVAAYARLKKPAVIGSTGVDQAGQAAVAAAAKVIPLIHAPNFSVGVNLLFALTQQAARVLTDGYDVEIVEMHHRKKKDAPSGTALRLADMIDAGRGPAGVLRRIYGREGDTGARPPGDMAIHSVRGGDVVGDHTVMFAAEGERVELTHKASSRDTFAKGALRAAAFLAGAAPGRYSMQDVLGF